MIGKWRGGVDSCAACERAYTGELTEPRPPGWTLVRVANKTIRIFLAGGEPIGILLAEISNWTGNVLVAPRSPLDQLSRREEDRRTGVHLLVGPDPDDRSRALASIGEGDNVLKRLLRRSWNEAKDFWERTVVMAPPGATAVDIKDAA